MKKAYDFAKAKRGRFYRPGARFNLPVYLEPDVRAWVDEAASARGEEVNTLVNRLVKKSRGTLKRAG